jgi:CheY-like chemotaxis protein
VPRLLLIDPDRDALVPLLKALAFAGLTDVAAMPSAAFALTTLERERPDVIVARAALPDIDGFELCAIVRSDPMTAGVGFLVLAASADEVRPTVAGTAPDEVLVGPAAPAAVVATVTALLARRVEASAPADAGAAPGAAEGQGIGGSLAVMDLPDLVQAIALAGKTGALRLGLDAGAGLVVFERGRIVHADFLDRAGEDAFRTLVATAHRQRSGTFAFEPADTLPAGVPRTLTGSVKQLLLSVASAIDESRTGSPRAAAPTS